MAASRTQIETDFNANKKTIELKKKILLAEARKKAYIGEWTEKEKLNAEAIAELKKDVKELTAKLTIVNNINAQRYTKEPQEIIRRTPFPPGAKTEAEAVQIYDLKIIDLQKQIDLLAYKFKQRKEYCDQLIIQYNQLLASKTEIQDLPCAEAPATIEEDEIRKRVCHLENEIHKINVQWMEAEHIRKKYKSIKASLTSDSDNFEKSLLELEQALEEQQVDINKMQQIHHDALQMRDTTKVTLHKQEHLANAFTRLRDRQALDLRREVDDRKTELERLERKLFSAGKTAVVHQGSVESLSTEPTSEKREKDTDPSTEAKRKASELEILFKKLVETTGATTENEVLERFISQKESSSRLNYLRAVTEDEKKNLEVKRETLLSQLETLKFSDVKDTEVNQEQVDALKSKITEAQSDKIKFTQETIQTKNVIEHIKLTIVDLILRLQEVAESLGFEELINETFSHSDLMETASDEFLLQTLEEKIKKALVETGQIVIDRDSGISDDEIEQPPKTGELHVPSSRKTSGAISRIASAATQSRITSAATPSRITSAATHSRITSATRMTSGTPSSRPMSTPEDRPQPYPSCYANLVFGRSSGQVSSASPGQTQPVAPTDDEGDVPSRAYLKRQAMYIVDSKSRRKGFRVQRR